MLPKLVDIFPIMQNEDRVVEYLLTNGAFDVPTECSSCNGALTLHGKSYRCRKQGCRKRVSALKNSFFAHSRLTCSETLLIGYLWLSECSRTTILSMTGHSTSTITDYLGHYRDLITGNLGTDATIIGGDGVIVEIDESKFAKRKYHRGHRVEGAWVVGGVERTPERRIFSEVVENRSAETLIDIISRHVHPGSIVHTDLWRGYASINRILGMEHGTVNHSRHFVDPDTGIHTNTIEGTWCGIKRKIPIRNRSGDTIEKHLLEFIWRRNNCNDLWGGLMRAFRETHYD